MSDTCCDALLDVEYRTIARRIVRRVTSCDPPTPLLEDGRTAQIRTTALDAPPPKA